MPAENNISPLPGFYRHIEACNRHEPADYLPLLCDGQQIGLIKRVNLELISHFPTVFAIEESAVRLTVCGSFAERTAALSEFVKSLAAQGIVTLRNEPYRISTDWHAEAIANIDRCAANFLGIKEYGIHLNGIVRDTAGWSLWLGIRAQDRVISPGKLDQMAAGGLPAGLTARDCMIKETGEEANVPPELAAKAVAVSSISYTVDVHNGIQRDTIFAFDLEVPPDFTPHNTDGEVDRFELLPVEEVAEIVRTTDRFKWNCNLVVIDFLIRHGYLDSAHPEYTSLCAGLHKAL